MRSRSRASSTSTTRCGADLEIAARFHDVGKMAMPEALVSKPSPLTRGESAIMRRHVDIGAEILESTRSLAAAAPAVRASHEWFGGGGYPRKAGRHRDPVRRAGSSRSPTRTTR